MFARATPTIIALLFVVVAPAGASEPKVSTSTTGPTSLALTISGGVSLGVYEAGFLYFLSETFKSQSDLMQARLFTGASAGSANALVSALASCSPANPDPANDLGWKMWMPVGYAELFDPSQVTPVSVFHPTAMEKSMGEIWNVWRRGLPESCDVVLGVSVTRVEHFAVQVSTDFSVPRGEEKFAVRIRGRGVGKPLKVTNYVDPYQHFPQPLLNLLPNDETEQASRHNFEQVRTLLFASAAFPFVFPPVRIPHCLTKPQNPTKAAQADRLECPKPERSDEFIDGGVFDNNPMRFSNALSEAGLRRDAEGNAYWRDLSEPPGSNRDPPDRSQILYVDPERTSYPSRRIDDAGPNSQAYASLLGLLGQVAGDLVVTARAKELYALVQESKDLSSRMRLSKGNYPKAGEELYAFLGFFEQEFRTFDFYLGMYDGWVQVGEFARESSLNVDTVALTDKPQSEGWRPLACLVSWYEPEVEYLRPACDGDALRNFRILLQISLDRVHDACREHDSERLQVSTTHPNCLRAAKGEAPLDVAGVKRISAALRMRADEESNLDHLMRLLTEYEFEFRDLGLTRKEAEYGRVKIRRRLLKVMNALGEAQPDAAEETLLRLAGRQLANMVAYEPPEHWWHVSIGSAVEVGASVLPFEWYESWARLNLAFDIKDIASLIGSDDPRARFTLTAGPELELLFMTTAALQPQIGLRAGYQFGTLDTLGAKKCTSDRALRDSRNCSQFIIHNYYALGIGEVFRLGLLLEFFPQSFEFGHKLLDLQFLLGVQFF